MLYINYLQEKSEQIKKIISDLFGIDESQDEIVEFPEKEERKELSVPCD